MKLFDKIFKKNKNCYKISQNQENSLVSMLILKKELKLNEKILVPENFCSVILSKEKLLDIIPSGEFELTGLTIPKACKINKLDKPTKRGYKTKFKCDFYFVNLSLCKIYKEFYIKKIDLNISYNLTFKIVEPIKFLNFLINEKIVFDDKFASVFLNFKLSQIIYYYFLDNKLIEKDKLENFVSKKLSSIGIEKIEFEIIYNKNEINLKGNEILKSENKLENKDIISNNTLVINSNKNTNESNKSLVSLDDVCVENISYFVCDCGVKLPANSKMCYNCKKSFEEKNCCEYCGREIKKGVFVCPYCKSVLIGN